MRCRAIVRACLGSGLAAAVAGCAGQALRPVCGQAREWKLPPRSETPAHDAPEERVEARLAEVTESIALHLDGVTVLGAEAVLRAALDEWHEIGQPRPDSDPGALAEDVKFRLEDEYHRRGYAGAEVTVTVGPVRAKGSRRVDVTAREGPRTLVTAIAIEGARHLSPAELARFYWDHAPRTVPVFGGHCFVERVAESAASRMAERYRSDGFRAARVRLDDVEWNEDRTEARLRYVVGEGPRARLARIRLEGRDTEHPEKTIPLDIPRDELAAVLEAAGIRTGIPYGLIVGSRARDALLRHYAEQGYPFTHVQLSERVATDAEGVPRYELGLDVFEHEFTSVCRVGVAGNTWTRDHVVRNEASHLIGRDYRASDVDAVQRALAAMGIFRSVHVQRQAVVETLPDGTTRPHPDLVDLQIDVEEADWAVVRGDLGFATNEGPRVGAAVDLNNLTSFGHSAQLRGVFSEIRQRVEGKLTAPRVAFGWLPLSRRPSFRVREGEFEATLSRPILGPLEALVGYRFRATTIYDEALGVAVASASAAAPVDDLRGSSIFLGWVLDGRDNRWNPREGAFASMTLTHSGRFLMDGTWEETFDDSWRGSLGGNMHLGQMEGQIAAYASAGRVTAAFRGAAAAVRYRPTHAQLAAGRFGRLPPPYRVFAGGHHSVRSFVEGELGPMSGDNPATPANEGGAPLGGLGRAVMNAELRVRLWPGVEESQFGLGAVFFFDAGSVWPYEAEALSMVQLTEGLAAGSDVRSRVRGRYRSRPEDVAFALGVGLRIETIIGPIGVELGWNPDRRRIAPVRSGGGPRHEDAFAVFFQVGQTF